MLCETIIIDQHTKNATLVNVFNRYFVEHFPGPTDPARAFVYLVNGSGDYNLSFEVRNLRDNSVVIASRKLVFHIKDRLEPFYIYAPFPSFIVPHEGDYDAIVLIDGHEIERQTFRAIPVGAKP